jgi:hypothetical protein
MARRPVRRSMQHPFPQRQNFTRVTMHDRTGAAENIFRLDPPKAVAGPPTSGDVERNIKCEGGSCSDNPFRRGGDVPMFITALVRATCCVWPDVFAKYFSPLPAEQQPRLVWCATAL